MAKKEVEIVSLGYGGICGSAEYERYKYLVDNSYVLEFTQSKVSGIVRDIIIEQTNEYRQDNPDYEGLPGLRVLIGDNGYPNEYCYDDRSYDFTIKHINFYGNEVETEFKLKMLKERVKRMQYAIKILEAVKRFFETSDHKKLFDKRWAKRHL